MTAVAALISASFASPIIVKGDALGAIAGHSKKASASQVEELVAGGYAFAKPEEWGSLGATAAGAQHGKSAREFAVGTVVSAVCPAGSEGGACADDLTVTFIAYDGDEGGRLPALPQFERQLDAQLPKRLDGFKAGEAGSEPGGDGSPWLRYAFSFERNGQPHVEVLGVYRHVDGSGVVAVAAGPTKVFGEHAKEIERFLASARDVEDAA